jgi:DNA-binding CsgD family transcriptional regulator
MWRGAGSDAYNRLTDEAARILDQAPAVTAVMLADAVMIAVVAGDILAAQTIALRAAEAGREAGGPLELLTSLTLEAVRLLRGEQAEIELPMGVIGEIPAHQLSLFAGATLVWMERYDDARLLLGRLVERARAASAPAELPYVLACLSDLDFRTGRWPAAYAGAAESCTLAQETRQTGALPFSLVCLGRVESAQGRETEARVHLERALELAAEIRSAAFEFVARAALGAHELACGRPDAAVQQLEVVRDTVAEHGLGEPNVIQWAPDLVEAYVRCGRGADGERVLATFSEQAESSRRLWARAGAARCRGLLAGAADFELAFVEALELHAQTPAPFERARTELCFGERLRRERRRADSRDWLRSAMETFEQLGAVPWADRARTELGASGEHARRGDAPASHELTPQELQIALVVAQGSTNKEAGAQLFLSPKTIETHLGRVYRKLNVRSRTELARLLATEEIPEQVGVAP